MKAAPPPTSLASTGASRGARSTRWCAAATPRPAPGRRSTARRCRSSTSRRSRRRIRRGSAASTARWSRSRPTASPSSAPTAASRSPASSPPTAPRSPPATGPRPPTSRSVRGSSDAALGASKSSSSPPIGGEVGRGGYRHRVSPPLLTSPPSGGEEFEKRNALLGENSYARVAAHQSEDRHPDRAGGQETADPRHRQGEARHRPGEPRAVRPLQGQDLDGLHQVAAEQAERQAHPGLGDLADAGRRRQDHHHGRPDRRAEPYRQEGDALPARA